MLKIITIFDEFMKSPTHQFQNVAEVTYEAFFRKYGLQNVSEKKYKQFLIALRTYSSKDSKIKHYAEHIGLLDNQKSKK